MKLEDIEENTWYYDVHGDYSLVNKVSFANIEVGVIAYINLSLASLGWSEIDAVLLIRPATELEMAYYNMEHI